MCGIAGFWARSDWQGAFQPTVRLMTDAISYRGPDDAGYWVERKTGVALGHRRLSILDLSPEGHQPMVSQSGRYVLSFNGEIYNFRALREALGNYGWRGHSDTEVMLGAIEAWGLERAVKRFNGMFAFTLWDREEQLLHLVRDRLGKKPMYYGWSGGVLLFGSELKALRAHPEFEAEIDRDALALLMRYGSIPTPYSIYRNVYKLPPGTTLTLSSPIDRYPSPVPFWSAKEVAEHGVANPFMEGDAEAVDHLDTLLREAVQMRMVADVPIGAFLSGGIDSSTVVGLMQTLSDRPVKTFSIGFRERDYNEAEHANAVARYLGTDHTELYVAPEDALAVIPKLPSLYDEPFADYSQIPTFLVSELARQYVTVSLSGDGGDELFGGYHRYFYAQRIWNSVGWIPQGARHTAAQALNAVSPEVWDRALGVVKPVLPGRLRQNPGDKVRKLAELLNIADSPEVLYHELFSNWRGSTSFVIGSSEPSTILGNQARRANLSDFLQWMMYTDLVGYLPDDILTKVDRASMAVSLEARTPLLDHRVVEFAWRVPLTMKIRSGKSKWLLRQLLYRYVPKELVERPKRGFTIPLDSWLRGPLRDWAETLLDEQRLRYEGFFDPAPIRQKWSEHLSGRRNWEAALWNVLMFQAWLEQQEPTSQAIKSPEASYGSIDSRKL